jgi:hypothetical protein
MPQIESSTYFFNPRELARLAAYRAAILAHFYTDQCEDRCEPMAIRQMRTLWASSGAEQLTDLPGGQAPHADPRSDHDGANRQSGEHR